MKNKFLWLPVLLLIGEAVSGQADQKFLTDPVAQLRQLVQKPQVNMPSLSMPTLANAPGKLPMPGYDIKKSIEKGMPFIKCQINHFVAGRTQERC